MLIKTLVSPRFYKLKYSNVMKGLYGFLKTACVKDFCGSNGRNTNWILSHFTFMLSHVTRTSKHKH